MDRIHAWSPYLDQLACVFNDYAQPVLRQQGASRAAWRQELPLVQLCHQLRVKVHEHFPVECNCLWVWFRTSEMFWWAVKILSAVYDELFNYLKVSLLLRIAGHAISASAPDRVSISNSFLQLRTKNCNFSIHCWSYISEKKRLADLIRFRAYTCRHVLELPTLCHGRQRSRDLLQGQINEFLTVSWKRLAILGEGWIPLLMVFILDGFTLEYLIGN